MEGSYVVAVIGGACAGSEIASQLAEVDMEVLLFEQNALPYGKIEDGLPRWHAKLQAKEMAAIDGRLSHPSIHYIPHCRFGEHVTARELIEEWGLSMVIMANGAWRDRPLRVDGVADVRDDSFVYQNPFIYWFNHYHQRNYSGKTYRVPPATVIIGGGLASIDVAKICQFQMVMEALRVRGIEIDLVSLDRGGIFKVLKENGLSYEELDLAPARLYYRKRVRDMPLMPLGEDPTSDKLEKAARVREKLIANARARYGFEVYPLRSPVKVLVAEGAVRGVTFEKSVFQEGRFVSTGQTETVATQLLISSIGSIPEPLEGVPMEGELYSWEDRFTGAVRGLPGVYCVGNAITGRGNIKESLQNARRLGRVIQAGIQSREVDYEGLFKTRAEAARAYVARMIGKIEAMTPLSPQRQNAILERVARMQGANGYHQDYWEWRDRVLSAR